LGPHAHATDLMLTAVCVDQKTKKQWLSYWIIFSLFTLVEFFFDLILAWYCLSLIFSVLIPVVMTVMLRMFS
jgi:hypothetical protein